jgi:hypothetical protein
MKIHQVILMPLVLLAGCRQANNQQDGATQALSSPQAMEPPQADIKPTRISTDASDLLKAGDPHVCANDQVESILFDILKTNSNYVKSYKDPYRQYLLDNLNITASDVTSRNVNLQSQTIECSATIHMSANQISQEFNFEAQLNYDVSQDLSNDDQVIVKTDMFSVEQPLKILGAQLLNKKFPR